MEIILLERVDKLGSLGDTVRVKNGYARNYLLPTGRALRATPANREKFEADRTAIEAKWTDHGQSHAGVHSVVSLLGAVRA